MMNKKFYIDTEANDDEAYRLAMQFASELANADEEIKRIVLYIGTKKNTGWFGRLYGPNAVKKLFDGIRANGCRVPFKFETKITYKHAEYGYPSDVVICCGTDSGDLLKLDSYGSVKYMIAIPWHRKLSEKWIKTWKPVEISGQGQDDIESFPEPSDIVKNAMQELTYIINPSTGITHSMDNDRAKTYIRALHKYEPELNSDIVSSYLIRELNWETRHASDIEKLIDTLNEGRYFQGGEKKGLQNHYKRWKNKN